MWYFAALPRPPPEALAGLHGALEGTIKWLTGDDIPERELAITTTGVVVIALSRSRRP